MCCDLCLLLFIWMTSEWSLPFAVWNIHSNWTSLDYAYETNFKQCYCWLTSSLSSRSRADCLFRGSKYATKPYEKDISAFHVLFEKAVSALSDLFQFETSIKFWKLGSRIMLHTAPSYSTIEFHLRLNLAILSRACIKQLFLLNCVEISNWINDTTIYCRLTNLQ